MNRSLSAPLLIPMEDHDDDYSSKSSESLRDFVQELVAELIGTYLYLLVGFGAIAVSKDTEDSFQRLGIVWGLDAMVLTYILGPVSAAHFNPSVTVAFAVFNKFPWKHVVPYILVQIVASTLASITIEAIYGKKEDLMMRTLPSASNVQSLAMEFMITFYLLFCVSGATFPPIKELSGLAAGAAIMINTFIAGDKFQQIPGFILKLPISGASMNPAGSLGPAIAFNGYKGIWIYVVGPIFGAITGCWFYTIVTFPKRITRPKTVPDKFIC